MFNKGILTTIAIVALSAAFFTISFLVYVSKGNPALVKRKLKIGAMLLLLTSTIIGCQQAVTCYEPARVNIIELNLEQDSQYNYKINLDSNNSVPGKISNRSNNLFSFQLTDTNEIEKQRGDILPKDGKFDSEIENFEFKIVDTLTSGIYWLNFFANSKDSIPQCEIERFRLNITNK